MIEPLLKNQLEPIAERQRSWFLWKSLAVWWGTNALAGCLVFLLSIWVGWSVLYVPPLLALCALTGAGALVIRASLWQPDYRQIARRIEQGHPDLHALLLTAVEQRPATDTGRLHYLQERVIQEAIQESRRQDWIKTVSRERLAAVHLLHWAALSVLVVVLTVFPVEPPQPPVLSQARTVTVTPGDVAVEKGQGLLVMVHFDGDPPAEVQLAVEEMGRESQRYPLARSLDDPLFGGSIPSVSTDLRYHAEFEEDRTRSFQVTVFEYPRLERADATLRFPTYTGLAEKQIKDTRRISAVEGTQLDLDFHLNKPVALANLVSRQSLKTVPLTVKTNLATAQLAGMTLHKSEVYSLELVDKEGRTNRSPSRFILEVLPNRRPELKLVAPKGDQRVSPLEEIAFQAETWDDFGLLTYGLHYSVAGGESHDVILGRKLPGQAKKSFEHLLSLEKLGAQVDQLISWYLWAEDIGPDGQVRRNFGDMYFAEVRPFEEIFRENPSQSGSSPGASGEEGAGNETLELAELQKEIMNATWRFIREESTTEPSPHYLTNIVVVRDSQQQALQQVQSLKENTGLNDAAYQPVEQAMEKALAHLTEAAESPRPLHDALADEQSAYQALLQISAREFLVSQNRSNSRNSRGQRNRQQLNQLELKQAQNRYETERQASPLQNPEQREQSQVLNRLKELARRQQDLNEQLQELQTALQQAQSESEREEIRRRLQRLREDERQMLADLDELRQRMARPQNQSRMAEARQQLDQTRSQVQQASEALDRQAVSQALAAGTRAQRQLQELREEFRKQNASQFTDQMRQMRQDARQLAQSQEAIREELDSFKQNRRNTLADTNQTENLTGQLQGQQQGLTNLLGNMRSVAEQADAIEPLLARQLHDAFRQTSQAQVDHSLELTQQLIERKFPEEASLFEQRAREEIHSLKEAVEQAAESVLGDDIEALRLARREIEDLARQVESEMQQATARSDQRSKTDNLASASPRPEAPSQPNPAPPQTDSAPPSQPSPPQPGDRFFDVGSGSGPTDADRPLTGSQFLDWSDRLRNVEEIVDVTDLRSQVARVRDRARTMRAEFKRHGKEPQWDVVRVQIVDPLRAVQNQIGEELARRKSNQALVPIDRDPVPARFSELVRKYYEKLGAD